MEEIKPSHTLDVKGKICPYPLFHTKKTIEILNKEEILEVIATDPVAPDNISSWAEDHGHEILEVKKEVDVFKIYVRKG